MCRWETLQRMLNITLLRALIELLWDSMEATGKHLWIRWSTAAFSKKGRSILNEHSDYHVFWDVARRSFVLDQRRLGKYVGPIFQGQAVQAVRLAFKYVAGMFSRNVGKQLPTEAKWDLRRAQISTLLRRRNLISTVRDSTMTFRVCYTSKHAIRIKYEADQLLILTFYFLWRCVPTQAMASSFTSF